MIICELLLTLSLSLFIIILYVICVTFFFDMILLLYRFLLFFFLMIRRPPRSTLDRSSAASDVYKRQILNEVQTIDGVKEAEGNIGNMDSGALIVIDDKGKRIFPCLLYTSPSPRDRTRSRMPSSA